MSRGLTTPWGKGTRMLRSPGDVESQTQRGGGGWREAPDHVATVFEATRRRLPRLLRIRLS